MIQPKPLEWHQIKETWVGMIGDEIVCIIDKMEDMPVEAVVIQQFSGVFTSMDAAKLSVEESLAKARAQRAKPPVDFVHLWRKVASVLEPAFGTANEDDAAEPGTAGGKA